MKAMILAAGLGTRLRPLTNTFPKALVEINGVTMLEIAIRRLIKAGFDELIINTHHFAGKIEEFLKNKDKFGIRIEISYEKELLDTGGGLKEAAWFFDDGAPFALYNADIYCDMDLKTMYGEHIKKGALATLAVKERESNSYLLFDGEILKGLQSLKRQNSGFIDSKGNLTKLAFSGIQIISPEFLSEMTEEGKFSIIAPYLRLAKEGAEIRSFRMDNYFWRDMGSLEKLEELRKYIAVNGMKV
ncbi:MAG: nucleotidyltransferase family protein [Elusimicrobiota bacterium]|nr:nucleotidyltransferase family protein [Elusimicrobiota bacterium]